jgi:pimeloyl-ACP methyl ester carboxylesterase
MDKLIHWLTGNAANAKSALADAKKADPAAIAVSRNYLQAERLFNVVNRQHTPSLLVNGAQDELVKQPTINHLSVLSELGHHIMLDEAGHFPMLDSTAKFNRLLTDFLALDSGLSIKELGLKEEWRRRVR